MIQADQRQVVQTANVNLVQIRGMEITYFSTFFSTFGTQCAVILAMLIGSVSQVPVLTCTCSVFFAYLYGIGIAGSFATAMHVLLCTVYISVYGQGLALRGPLGSMVKAVEGMVDEQQQIVVTFVWCIIFLALSTIGTFFLMFDQWNAVVSSIPVVVGFPIWYHYTLRIYNRFKFSRDTQDLVFEGHHDISEVTLKPAPELIRYPLKDIVGEIDDSRKRVVDRITSLFKQKTIEKAALRDPMLDEHGRSNHGVSTQKIVSSLKATSPLVKDEPVDFEYSGYITLRTGPDSMFSDPWKRQFVGLRDEKLYFYFDKNSWESNPLQPLNKRPLELEGLALRVMESDDHPYTLVLYSQNSDGRKLCEFRCDTNEETRRWIDVFRNVFNSIASKHAIAGTSVIN